MKRKLQTVGEVLRTLRIELKRHQGIIREGRGQLPAVSIEQRECAVEALRYAIQHIQKHRLTVSDLKKAIEETRNYPPKPSCLKVRMTIENARAVARSTRGKRIWCDECHAWHVDAMVGILPFVHKREGGE